MESQAKWKPTVTRMRRLYCQDDKARTCLGASQNNHAYAMTLQHHNDLL